MPNRNNITIILLVIVIAILAYVAFVKPKNENKGDNIIPVSQEVNEKGIITDTSTGNSVQKPTEGEKIVVNNNYDFITDFIAKYPEGSIKECKKESELKYITHTIFAPGNPVVHYRSDGSKIVECGVYPGQPTECDTSSWQCRDIYGNY